MESDFRSAKNPIVRSVQGVPKVTSKRKKLEDRDYVRAIKMRKASMLELRHVYPSVKAALVGGNLVPLELIDGTLDLYAWISDELIRSLCQGAQTQRKKRWGPDESESVLVTSGSNMISLADASVIDFEAQGGSHRI